MVNKIAYYLRRLLKPTFREQVVSSVGRYIKQFDFAEKAPLPGDYIRGTNNKNFGKLKDLSVTYVRGDLQICFYYDPWDRYESFTVYHPGESIAITNKIISDLFMTSVRINFRCDMDNGKVKEFTHNVLRLLKEPKGRSLLVGDTEFYKELCEYSRNASQLYTAVFSNKRDIPHLDGLYHTNQRGEFLRRAREIGIDKLSEENKKRYYELVNENLDWGL